jgi:hypothetical protein
MKWAFLASIAGIGVLLAIVYVDLRLEEAKWDRTWARVQGGEVLHLPELRLK